ncbi:acyl-CoA carboxylase subunit epsilon [Corynebacterium sp. YSMAA1_1_F7]|uniref:acyl-CoA carboxylase subunit epsilon n=1 Tax=Corynebacterium sp. YSMAA1_1_F7 TaxID=3383590 RepID=UPI0038D23D87
MTDFQVIKGNPNEVETRALQLILDDLAAEAEALRNAKPDTRGHYGHSVLHGNPGAFRNPRMPRG